MTLPMKLVAAVVLSLGLFACGGKKAPSTTTTPTPTMKGTGGSTYGGASYGGTTYGGAKYGGR
jgi:hypothetical protein